MSRVDRLTLVELIEAEKAKLSPEALELWEELDASIYLGPEGETTLNRHEADLMYILGQRPEADKHVVNLLTELRAGLYQSDYSEQRGDPSQCHRDKCVVHASITKDRDKRDPGEPLKDEDLMNRTVDRALARLRED